MNISAAEAREMLKPQPKGRFRRSAPARRTVDGILFDSIAECHRYVVLRMMEREGKISELHRQVAPRLSRRYVR